MRLDNLILLISGVLLLLADLMGNIFHAGLTSDTTVGFAVSGFLCIGIAIISNTIQSI